MNRQMKSLAKALALFCTLSAAGAVHAQEWKPTRPVKIIVPIVGSTNDAIARLVAPKLQEVFGQPVVVENKGGGGGNIGADFVAKSAPDGHTILVGYNGPLAINPTLFNKMPYDAVKDFAPITLAVTSPQYLAVNSQLPVKTVGELIAMAKANPEKLSYASVSMGSASHLTMEMLKIASNTNITHVSYRGAAPAVTDMLAGNVHASFMVPGNVLQYVKEGRLRLLASTGEKRFSATPDVPTMIESGYPDFVATSWVGFVAPRGTPRNVIDRYNKEIVKALNTPDIKERLKEMQFDLVASSPEQFSDWIRSEIQKWGKVIKATGTKVE